MRTTPPLIALLFLALITSCNDKPDSVEVAVSELPASVHKLVTENAPGNGLQSRTLNAEQSSGWATAESAVATAITKIVDLAATGEYDTLAQIDDCVSEIEQLADVDLSNLTGFEARVLKVRVSNARRQAILKLQDSLVNVESFSSPSERIRETVRLNLRAD